MSFSAFQSAVNGMAERAGYSSGDVRFCHEDGKHIAQLPEGITITGNTVSTRVAVRWGSGHSAYV